MVSPIEIRGSQLIGLTDHPASRTEAFDVRIAVGGKRLEGGVRWVHSAIIDFTTRRQLGKQPWPVLLRECAYLVGDDAELCLLEESPDLLEFAL
jgi:hypothetical protein